MALNRGRAEDRIGLIRRITELGQVVDRVEARLLVGDVDVEIVLLALLIDTFLFCVLPQIALDTPGLIAGWLLMVILNTGLVFVKPNAALGERLLGLRVTSEGGGGPALPARLS